jgi:predicted enzyme related to lactoylglutathione lyase
VAAIGTLSGVALECRDPEALASFYSSVFDWPIAYRSDDWWSVGRDAFHLSFQRSPGHQPPTWPDPASSMQFHLHVRVADLDVAQAAILALGGTLMAHQPHPDTARVFADPAGHPFCVVGAR